MDLATNLIWLHLNLCEELQVYHGALKPANYFVLEAAGEKKLAKPVLVLSDFYMSVHVQLRAESLPRLSHLGRERRWIGPELAQKNYRLIQACRCRITEDEY